MSCSRIAGHIGVDPIVGGAKFDPAHILDADHGASIVAPDDDVAELVGGEETAFCLDVQLEGPAAVSERRRADGAGGDLKIMAAKRIHHFIGGQVARGGAVRIDPDAHGVVANRAAADVANAVNPQ